MKPEQIETRPTDGREAGLISWVVETGIGDGIGVGLAAMEEVDEGIVDGEEEDSEMDVKRRRLAVLRVAPESDYQVGPLCLRV